jgi:threonine-phosphate decarboxylase
MLKGHGDNGYSFDRNIVADFSSNVWSGGEPAGLKEHVFRQWKQINKYPEVLAESLTEKVSRHHGLQPENILICNGSTESIYLIAQAFKRRKSGIVFPGFAEYEDACSMHEHTIQFLPWEEIIPDLPVTTDLFWIANPNNPTGAVFFEMEALIRNHPSTIFIVDEAFIEFTQSIRSIVPETTLYPNLVVLRSLTKVFAIPGLRLGYITGAKNIIDKIRAVKLPWSVNVPALQAGAFIFDHYADVQPPFAGLLQNKAAFQQALKEIPIKVFPGHTHFFLCETEKESAKELQKWLLRHSGLLIRAADNFRGLGPGHFRLATLSPDKNQLLINALREWKKRFI